ncbi:unnamed protein product, partial [Polarella glacialis]
DPDAILQNLMNAWKAFRIPRDHRMFTLGRCYIQQVKWFSKVTTSWKDIKCNLTFVQREMKEYFMICGMSPEGATNALKEQIVSSTIADDDLETHRQGGGIREKVMASVGEMELIGLIALAAAELRRRKPFQDHPANQNFSEKVNEGLVSGRFRRVLDQRKREAQQ